MKVKYLYIAIVTLLASTFLGCNDWTEIESKDFYEKPSEDYFASLRAYKKSDHEVSFGWFGNWSGKGASLVNCMDGLPDSVDFISMWGGWINPTKEMLEDLRYVQNVKGTKALVCFIVLEMGDQITPTEWATSRDKRHEFWGWVDGDEEKIRESIVRYANAICDTIDKYDYDGFDLDWEPSYAQPFETNKEMARNGRIALFLETMSKRIGLQSGTDRMLVIDGEPEHSEIPREMGKHFNYFISQAYGSGGESGLQSRLNRVINHYDGVLTPEEVAARFIVCENFESMAQTGGATFTTPDGKQMPSLLGMAQWQPTVNGKKVRKGGVGTFHMEYDYPNKDAEYMEYKYLRKAISIMNPSVK